jgi:hypothetical protein
MLDGCDTSEVITEPLTWQRPEPADLALISAAPELEARVVAHGTLTFLGYVPDEAPFTVRLSLKVNDELVAVGFDKSMAKEDMLEALRRALPDGYEAAANEGSQSEVLIVDVFSTQRRRKPQVFFACTDDTQNVVWAGPNKFVISGAAKSHASELSLRVGKQLVKVRLNEGDQPIATAHRVRAALPEDLTAIIELPFVEGADVSVTVLSRKG